ncbi:uncharacterized mitochondrial protein AtMg00810-like [Rutidosis leptorrhynchoides]|uniref:uncharacterized mitochondrial protein AtMg00810-like n=1 Tax=Rutidosis leptorrhynchoides TaxID=125765 RepID=UPI003A99BF11
MEKVTTLSTPHIHEQPSEQPSVQRKCVDPIINTPCHLCPSSSTEHHIVHETPSSTDATPSLEPSLSPVQSSAPASTSITSSHPMITRSKAGIFKPKHVADLSHLSNNGLLSALFATQEPKGFKSAAKDPSRLRAMHEEMSALQRNHTWDLVPRPANSNVVGSKWVFRTKYHSDGSINRHKARLVAQVYVDDIIITGNHDNTIRTFISRLHKEFSITDLGLLNYFLGLKVTYTKSGLFLSQAKYAHGILVRAGLLDAKPAATPLATAECFTSSGSPFPDTTLYRSLVGALQYLTITRPDLSYAVNQVSQFLHAPTLDHYQAVKRIIWYVKGTLSFGLSFYHSPTPSLVGYSDADWARCIETRRSTYGYSIFLGGNLVSWSAKKQPTVSRSSCESEYRALANTAAEIV